jgi:hypothetical protein
MTAAGRFICLFPRRGRLAGASVPRVLCACFGLLIDTTYFHFYTSRGSYDLRTCIHTYIYIIIRIGTSSHCTLLCSAHGLDSAPLLVLFTLLLQHIWHFTLGYTCCF